MAAAAAMTTRRQLLFTDTNSTGATGTGSGPETFSHYKLLSVSTPVESQRPEAVWFQVLRHIIVKHDISRTSLKIGF